MASSLGLCTRMGERPLRQVLGQVALGKVFAQGKYFPMSVSMFSRICCVLKQNKRTKPTHTRTEKKQQQPNQN